MARRARANLYRMLIGAVVGALLTGVVLPFVVDGGASTSTATSSGPAETEGGLDGGRDVPEGAEFTGTTTPVASPLDGEGRPSAPSASTPRSADGSGIAGPDGTARTASDRGVTSSSVKVGVILLDTSTLAAAGFAPGNFTPEYQQRAYQAFVDEVNARGGINGRKLTAVYAKSDPLQADTAIAACESVVVDHGAFAVFTFAGFPTQAMLCVTEQHKTPLIAFNGYVPDEFFQRAQGRLVVEGMRGSRVMYNWVHELHALGLLKQKKIGVLYSDETAGGDRQNTEKALLPALAEYGYEVTHRTKLAAGIHTAAGQIPVEVSQMRQSGVDTVLIATNCVLAPQWVQQAESQGWRPQYVVGDHQGMSISEQCVGSMPTSFDGAVGVTAYSYPGGGAAREGIPEPDVDRRCREIYNRASGEGVKWGDAHPYKAACGQVLMFERALAAAGTNPTRTQWASELRSLGTFALPIVLGGGFNDRTDFADMIKTVRADKGCDCYRTTSAARRARF